MTTAFRRDAPVSWATGVKSTRRVGVRPTGLVAGALLGAATLVALAVAGWGIKELSILWGAASILALAGVVVLTLRGFPLFAILTVVAGAVVWGAATRGRLPDGWMDILGLLKFIGINLAFVVPLVGAFLSALLLDARRMSRAAIDEAVSGRRWWGKPDDQLPRLKELETIPAARFFALGEGGCTHLVVSGRRVALFLPTVWPHGEFTMDAAGQVLRGNRLFVPGSEDVDGLAAEVHTWREQLGKIGGSVRGYLVVAPSRGDVSEDLVIAVAPGEHLHLVHAHQMVEAAGQWLSAEPYRVDLAVMERLLVIASGNQLPEPSPLARTFAREAQSQPAGRTALPTDAAFAAASNDDDPLAERTGPFRARLGRGRSARGAGDPTGTPLREDFDAARRGDFDDARFDAGPAGRSAGGGRSGRPDDGGRDSRRDGRRLDDNGRGGQFYGDGDEPVRGDFESEGPTRGRFGRSGRSDRSERADRSDGAGRADRAPADDGSWEARSTRELVGAWDTDSASKLAAWAAGDPPAPSSPSRADDRPSSDEESPRVGRRRARSDADDDFPASSEPSRWSSTADDFPVMYETGTWPNTPDAPPAPVSSSDRWSSVTGSPPASVGAVSSPDRWSSSDPESDAPARAERSTSFEPSVSSEASSSSRTSSSEASELSASSGFSGFSGSSRTPAPFESSEPASRAGRRRSWSDEPDEQPAPADHAVTASAATSAPPAFTAPAASAAPPADDRRSDNRSFTAEPPKAPVRPTVEWRTGTSSEQSGAQPADRGPHSFTADSDARPAAPEPPAPDDWRTGRRDVRPAAAESPASDDWRTDRFAASRPADRPADRSADRPVARPAARDAGRSERPSWGGSLFDGEAPELVAKPLELRRSWESDPASRSVRRRDRVQPSPSDEQPVPAPQEAPATSSFEAPARSDPPARPGSSSFDAPVRPGSSSLGPPTGPGSFPVDAAGSAGAANTAGADGGTAWWEAETAGPAPEVPEAEPVEKPAGGKRSRWGRNRSAEKSQPAVREPEPPAVADWATESTTGWDRAGEKRKPVSDASTGRDRATTNREAAPEPTSRWDALRAGPEPAPEPASRWDGLVAPEEPAPEVTSRWDRLGAGQGAPAERPAWATDPTSSYESEPSGEFVADRRSSSRAEAQPSSAGERVTVPGQRNRDVNAFDEDVAPLELNLDEEPRDPEQRPRRFLRRK